MIDLHAHYLPGIDDGPASLEAALEMARLAVADGITAVTVTPHHLNGRYVNEAPAIRTAVTAFREALAAAGIALDVYPGSEVHLVAELPDSLADGTAMTVADLGHAVLVEPPVYDLPLGTETILSLCLAQGITPIIAHPERCRRLQQDIAPLERWVAMGCLVQVTAQSCSGHFGRRVQSAARAMLARGLVHLLASDGHRPYGRVPCLAAGRAMVSSWIGAPAAALMTEDYPQVLLSGELPDRARLRQLIQAGEPAENGEEHRFWWSRLRRCG